MKKIPALFRDWFSPKDLHGLDVQEILGAMADTTTRNLWIYGIFEEMQRLNLEVDKRLLSDSTRDITDLAARRKAFQDILEGVLAAKRRARNNNPVDKSSQFDLDSVTVLPV